MVKGTSSNLECGGGNMGYCNRHLGLCVCKPHHASSDGNGSVGASGDCGFWNHYPSYYDVSADIASVDVGWGGL